MTSRGYGWAAIALVAFTTNALAKDKAVTRREMEEHACYHDATTLCNEFVPDEAKITACMTAKKDQLSPGCAKMFGKSN